MDEFASGPEDVDENFSDEENESDWENVENSAQGGSSAMNRGRRSIPTTTKLEAILFAKKYGVRPAAKKYKVQPKDIRAWKKKEPEFRMMIATGEILAGRHFICF